VKLWFKTLPFKCKYLCLAAQLRAAWQVVVLDHCYE
jgi:hypothetical protein